MRQARVASASPKVGIRTAISIPRLWISHLRMAGMVLKGYGFAVVPLLVLDTHCLFCATARCAYMDRGLALWQ